jgi:nicotinate-nucleotide adenylyltransferase
MADSQKVGIFAGTFDPIHNGHIEFAKSAIAEAQLDKVLIVAEKEPYRKKPHASWDHRQAMIERATQDLERVDHDYHFAAELAHQHTLQNMLSVAKKHYGADIEVWFLVGSDVYEHIHQWEDITKDHDYGGFVVALRDDHSEQWLKQQQEKVVELGVTVGTVVIKTPHAHVSSSAIRDNAKQHDSKRPIDDKVGSYIQTHQLYQ